MCTERCRGIHRKAWLHTPHDMHLMQCAQREPHNVTHRSLAPPCCSAQVLLSQLPLCLPQGSAGFSEACSLILEQLNKSQVREGRDHVPRRGMV